MCGIAAIVNLAPCATRSVGRNKDTNRCCGVGTCCHESISRLIHAHRRDDNSASVKEQSSCVEACQEMVARLRRRGPDDEAIVRIGGSDFATPEIFLGHTRLAIVGGGDARSPFVWTVKDDGSASRMALIHNGEIYNHVDLRHLLTEEGLCDDAQFHTRCDSEVLLACCALKGVEWTLSHVRGIFAFVLVEYIPDDPQAISSASSEHDFVPCSQIKRIILARDTFGVKPLCCATETDRPDRLVFASQVSAIDPATFVGDNVQIVDIPPGHYQEYTFHRQEKRWSYSQCTHRYTSCDFDKNILLRIGQAANHIQFSVENDDSLDVDRPIGAVSFQNEKSLDRLRDQLIEAVKSRLPPLEKDTGRRVKTAILLSGGLDSSLIASIVSDLLEDDEELYTFNISYDGEGGAKGTDQAYARQVRDSLSKKRVVHHEEISFSFQEGIEVLEEVIDSLETYDAVSVRAGVPLFVLSRHIKARGFKVLLCGEGADEIFGGYRLFESYQPGNEDEFNAELCRRLANIDTSELQRLDRVTSHNGLEARVPFLDLRFVATAMQFPVEEKMSHMSQGRIQKYVLRRAFSKRERDDDVHVDSWLPYSVLFREKEQLADGIGREWVDDLRIKYAIPSTVNLDGEEAEKALYKRLFCRSSKKTNKGLVNRILEDNVRLSLVRDRQCRRQQNWKLQTTSHAVATGKAQPCRWYPMHEDGVFAELALSEKDVLSFIQEVLKWPDNECIKVRLVQPSLDLLNKLIVSMLEHVPFHNLTLLVRPRRPPTTMEMKDDMMKGIGGPCAVVNTFFAALLVSLGFGPHVYLLSCEINGRFGCHVAVLVQIQGLRYFVDVANGKPYTEAIHLGDSSPKTSFNGSFSWNLAYNTASQRMELMHWGRPALSFDPTLTVPFHSFRDMIQRSRSDTSFGPFLTGLRFCLFSNDGSTGTMLIKAVRDMNIYHGATMKDVSAASSQDDISNFAEQYFQHITGFCDYVHGALAKLDAEVPGWFERACEKNRAIGHQA